MAHGLPAMCGIAMGVDRLLMLALGARNIDEVLAFPLERA
jgi:lysyl-tRNA synthetase class 2